MMPAIDEHFLRSDEKVIDHDSAKAAVNLQAGGQIGVQRADHRRCGRRTLVRRRIGQQCSSMTVDTSCCVAPKAEQICRLAEEEIHGVEWIDAGVEDRTAGESGVEQSMGPWTPKGEAEVGRDVPDITKITRSCQRCRLAD